MNIIGRSKEIDFLNQCVDSKRPEFMVVYGRRRVGKTFLIKEYFNNSFSFYATGMLNGKTKNQLHAFGEALRTYGDKEKKAPDDWFEAFRRLRNLLEVKTVIRDTLSSRRIVFLDEVPWMDTARSDFKPALDYFWNSWAASQTDLLFIICGSATAWIINNILFDKGGFYNRITRQLPLAPFSLAECEDYFKINGIAMTHRQVIDSYLVFGGIPYYLNLFDKRLSLIQNIDNLIFNPQGQLHYEYDHLFESLYKKPENHIKIISVLADKKTGLLRTEIAKKSKVPNGEGLTKALNELEQCGFIRKYKNYTKEKQGFFFQLIDPFILFSHNFLKKQSIASWQSFYKSPAFYAWRGNAFEILCLCHIPQIKNSLGISGVSTVEYAWNSKQKKDGAQIDLLIDRKDDVINICEMKYTDEEFSIDSKYEKELLHKLELFRTETNPRKALLLTLISATGLKKNEYSNVIQNVVTFEALDHTCHSPV